MGKTYKDQKRNKRFDNRMSEHKSGVKKQFKRSSNKKARKTPLTTRCLDMQYSEQKVNIKIPQNIVKGSIPVIKEIEITITVATPRYVEIENIPRGLDIWSFE